MKASEKNRKILAKSNWNDLATLAKKANNYQLLIDFFDEKIGLKLVSKKLKVRNQYKLFEREYLSLVDENPTKASLLYDEYYYFIIEKICLPTFNNEA